MAKIASTTVSIRRIDLVGQKFGRWTVIAFTSVQKEMPMWLCRCECGIEKEVHGGNLRKGLTRSCGCLKREVTSRVKRTHGASNGGGIRPCGPLYQTWLSMRRRCLTETSAEYANYGGRGIGICDRWQIGDGVMSGYECFLADMGPKPSGEHSVERQDTNGNYEPGNCIWATPTVQTRNKRSNRWVEFGGERMVMADAIVKSGIPEWTVYARLDAGWSEDRALTQPVRIRRWRGPKTRAAEKLK